MDQGGDGGVERKRIMTGKEFQAIVVAVILMVCVLAVTIYIATRTKEPKKPITIDNIQVKPLGTTYLRCPHCDREMPASMFEVYTPSGLWRFEGEWKLKEPQ